MSRNERVFRRLVGLYPDEFRAKYEHEMVVLFADQLRDARTSGAKLRVPWLWARTIADLIATAPEQHLRKEQPMLQPVEPTNLSAERARPSGHSVAVVVASVPVILWVVIWFVAPDFMAPVLSNPPAVLGVPMGAVIIVFAGGMATFGWLVARHVQAVWAMIGTLLFLTLPALLLIVMTPSLILGLVNMSLS